jgi:hypothetical protein
MIRSKNFFACFVSFFFTLSATPDTALSNSAPQKPIKLYVCYTPSHEVLMKEWFLPSLQDDYELVIEKFDQECESATYMSTGWKKTTLKKVEFILRAVQENWETVFIFADADIQFFRPSKESILHAIEGKDIVCQKNAPKGKFFETGDLCSGFFACACNEKTLRLWQLVKKCMMETEHSDQNSLNTVLKNENHQLNIVWDYLPNNFFGGGLFTGKYWCPGDPLTIPDNIIMHHANWTAGIPNKIAQLKYVRELAKKDPPVG